MTKHIPHSFCSYCGHEFHEHCVFPKKCVHCGNITYRNPVPATVVVLPVDAGILVVKRSIDPGKDQYALPGGFVDFHDRHPETWQEAGARELKEEACVIIDPSELKEYKVMSTSHGPVLIFGVVTRHRTSADLPPFVVNNEVSERSIVTEPIELAFPFHTQVLAECLTKLYITHTWPF